MQTNPATFPAEPAHTAITMTLAFYQEVGFQEPWISYLAQRDEQLVGICSFKGAPINGRVEIAYFTFPAYEGQGIATAMCGQLVTMAREAQPDIILTARTLPETNASTHVLAQNHFTLTGTVTDPEDGEVYEWVLQP